MKKLLTIFLIVLIIANAQAQKFENLALTPPMGWNSWNAYQIDVDENKIREAADAMVSSGMKDAGYEYIVIDDGWQIGRDEDGNILPDPDRFPSGIKALADYVHSKGLKFGIYSDAGTATCKGRTAMRGYEYQDTKTFAEWGVDFIKVDWCNHGVQNSIASYTLIRDAIYKAGRPVVFSICEWGSTKPWTWAKDVGHMWRTTSDILKCWDCYNVWGGMGWTKILDLQVGLEEYAGPDHWNDPDMMEVGSEGLTVTESKSHFSLWCMLAAPLMAGNNLTTMSEDIRKILTNREAIAINQDVLGKQGKRLFDNGEYEVWTKELEGDELAVCLLNRSDETINTYVEWEAVTEKFGLENIKFDLLNVWTGEIEGNTNDVYRNEIPPHDVIFFRLKKSE